MFALERREAAIMQWLAILNGRSGIGVPRDRSSGLGDIATLTIRRAECYFLLPGAGIPAALRAFHMASIQSLETPPGVR